MTREEAIDNLQDLWNEVYNEDSDGYNYAVAIDMAIEALKGGDAEMNEVKSPYMQETPSEDGNDLISRADAIEAICNAQCELNVPYYPQCDQVKYCDEIQALLALPSAEAVQGEWTNEDGKPITDKFSVYCSRCKEWSEYRTNYCGHCGARMFKGGDDTTGGSL